LGVPIVDLPQKVNDWMLTFDTKSTYILQPAISVSGKPLLASPETAPGRPRRVPCGTVGERGAFSGIMARKMGTTVLLLLSAVVVEGAGGLWGYHNNKQKFFHPTESDTFKLVKLGNVNVTFLDKTNLLGYDGQDFVQVRPGYPIFLPEPALVSSLLAPRSGNPSHAPSRDPSRPDCFWNRDSELHQP